LTLAKYGTIIKQKVPQVPKLFLRTVVNRSNKWQIQEVNNRCRSRCRSKAASERGLRLYWGGI